MHIDHVKTANKKEDQVYDTFKTVLDEDNDSKITHTVEVRLLAHTVTSEQEDLYYQVWIDGQLTETSGKVRDGQRAYVQGRKAWHKAITQVLDNVWPLAE